MSNPTSLAKILWIHAFGGPLQCQELQLYHGVIQLSWADVSWPTWDQGVLRHPFDWVTGLSVQLQLHVHLHDDVPKTREASVIKTLFVLRLYLFRAWSEQRNFLVFSKAFCNDGFQAYLFLDDSYGMIFFSPWLSLSITRWAESFASMAFSKKAFATFLFCSMKASYCVCQCLNHFIEALDGKKYEGFKSLTILIVGLA